MDFVRYVEYGPGEVEKEFVDLCGRWELRLVRIKNGFGGTRAFWMCPYCRRRVRFLYFKTNLTDNGSVDTGRLRNSITHIVDESELSVTVGTNVEYASYVCLGTGKYYPGGRPKPWPYQDAKGNWHWTAGNPAKPFLKPAIADHADVYRKIIKDALSNA